MWHIILSPVDTHLFEQHHFLHFINGEVLSSFSEFP